MSKFRDKNLLFYRPNDQISRQFLADLDKNKPLKSQFILINQDDPRISLPDRVVKMGQPLILIAYGVDKTLVGKDAVFWLHNNGFAKKGNGLEYFQFGGSTCGGSPLDEGNDPVAGTSHFSAVGERQAQIDTFEDSGRSVKESEINQRLNRLKADRQAMGGRGGGRGEQISPHNPPF